MKASAHMVMRAAVTAWPVTRILRSSRPLGAWPCFCVCSRLSSSSGGSPAESAVDGHGEMVLVPASAIGSRARPPGILESLDFQQVAIRIPQEEMVDVEGRIERRCFLKIHAARSRLLSLPQCILASPIPRTFDSVAAGPGLQDSIRAELDPVCAKARSEEVVPLPPDNAMLLVVNVVEGLLESYRTAVPAPMSAGSERS